MTEGAEKNASSVGLPQRDDEGAETAVSRPRQAAADADEKGEKPDAPAQGGEADSLLPDEPGRGGPATSDTSGRVVPGPVCQAGPVQECATPQSAPRPDEPATESPGQTNATSAELRKLLVDSQEQLSRLGEALVAVDDKVSLIPRHVRALGNKVDGLGSTVGEPRCRALLMDLLRICDLVEQLGQEQRAASEGTTGRESQQRYDILRTQVRQILAVNGVTEIVAEGVFDAEVHRAILRVPCDDPAKHGQIKAVTRAGFRTGQNVLRYPEVEVWSCASGQATAEVNAQEEAAPGAEPEEQEGPSEKIDGVESS